MKIEIFAGGGASPLASLEKIELANRIGLDGRSAYDMAVENGYEGSYEDYSAQASLMPAFGARLDGMESSKADLGADGYVVTEQISPLQGLSTGADTGSVSFSGAYTPSETFTRAFHFTTGSDVTRGQYISYPYNSYCGVRVGNDGTIWATCVGLSSRVPSLPDTTYFIVCQYDAQADMFRIWINGVLYSSGNSTTFSMPVGLSLGSYLNQEAARFEGTIHSFRDFNFIMDAGELWNGGRPDKYIVPQELKGDSENKCTLDLVPAGLRDNGWLDPSNGKLLPALGGKPDASYRQPGDMLERTIDTGVFYTDIADGVSSKIITVPRGYYVDKIALQNFNDNDVTHIRMYWGFGGGFMLANSSLDSAGQYNNRLLMATPQSAYIPSAAKGDSGNIYINATGNTPEGGMRVILKLKYIGS